MNGRPGRNRIGEGAHGRPDRGGDGDGGTYGRPGRNRDGEGAHGRPDRGGDGEERP